MYWYRQGVFIGDEMSPHSVQPTFALKQRTGCMWRVFDRCSIILQPDTQTQNPAGIGLTTGSWSHLLKRT
jgi:hypothetical protein